MALIKCHECGNEVSTEARKCPKCGATVKSKSNKAGAVIGVLVAAAAVWYFVGGGVEQQAARSMEDITHQVADDAVKQYGIAKRNGQPTDVCVAAMSVSAAYLQAKDEPNYQHWRSIERDDCKAAGMPGS